MSRLTVWACAAAAEARTATIAMKERGFIAADCRARRGRVQPWPRPARNASALSRPRVFRVHVPRFLAGPREPHQDGELWRRDSERGDPEEILVVSNIEAEITVGIGAGRKL